MCGCLDICSVIKHLPGQGAGAVKKDIFDKKFIYFQNFFSNGTPQSFCARHLTS